jgi:LPS export ABC transporter protein LptC
VAIVVLFVTIACNSKPHITDSVSDRTIAPRLNATDIMTIISDSGITRYRITTPQWLVYDKAEEPFWEFPQGLHFDRFDEKYNVDAQIDCRHAFFYDNIQLWVLTDSVRATNLQEERFETEKLYWNQKEERIYSDSTITIYKQGLKIIGLGFESNQTMTNYRIIQPTGIIPVDEDENEATETLAVSAE